MATKRRRSLFSFRNFFLLLLFAGCLIGYALLGPNTGDMTEGNDLYIPTGATYTDVLNILKRGNYLRSTWTFDQLARRVSYDKHVGAGKYHIRTGMSNFQIVRMLHGHRQVPVKLVLRKVRTKAEFIRFVSNNLEADSLSMRQLMADGRFLKSYNLDSSNSMCAVFPDTYEFYWNTNATQVFRKIAKVYLQYWTPERKQAAAKQGLTPQQATILASIVDEETNNNPEKPLVASVYLNRLKKGMRLQADPTARFAWGDFSIRRITSVQTQFMSPYNTYLVEGLPPGPICTPSTASIQAVLYAPSNDYVYFCAKGDGSGTHLFAANYDDHLKNAQQYHKTLDSFNIH